MFVVTLEAFKATQQSEASSMPASVNLANYLTFTDRMGEREQHRVLLNMDAMQSTMIDIERLIRVDSGLISPDTTPRSSADKCTNDSWFDIQLEEEKWIGDEQSVAEQDAFHDDPISELANVSGNTTIALRCSNIVLTLGIWFVLFTTAFTIGFAIFLIVNGPHLEAFHRWLPYCVGVSAAMGPGHAMICLAMQLVGYRFRDASYTAFWTIERFLGATAFMLVGVPACFATIDFIGRKW